MYQKFICLFILCALATDLFADNDDQISEAIRLTLGQEVQGIIDEPAGDEAFDVDMYSVTIGGPRTLKITADTIAKSSSLINNTDLAIIVYDSAGNEIRDCHYSTEAIPLPAAGTYYIAASDYRTLYDPVTGSEERRFSFVPPTNRIDYRFTAELFPEDTNDQISESTVVTPGVVATGRFIHANDAKMYRVDLPAGRRLKVTLGGTQSFHARVFLPSGNQIGNLSDGRSRTQLIDLPRNATASTYYVGVSYSGNSKYDAITGTGDTFAAESRIGDYRLLLEAIAPDEDNQVSEAISVAPDTTTTGVLAESTDVDMYAVEMEANTRLYAETDGRTTLRIFDSDGKPMGSSHFRLSREISETGTYYVGVSERFTKSYNAVTGTGVGFYSYSFNEDYQLNIQQIPADEDDSIGEAIPLASGTSATGIVDRDVDVDLYRIEADRAGDLLILIKQLDVGFFGVVLRVFDSSGNEILVTGDRATTVPVSQAGTYYVGVSYVVNDEYDPQTGGGDLEFDEIQDFPYEITVRSNTDYFVNSYRDAGDNNRGDGIAWTGQYLANGEQEVTMRAAIQEANEASLSTTIRPRIAFRFPNPGPHIIQPRFAWPQLNQRIIIDGLDVAPESPDEPTFSSEPGPRVTPIVQIDGSLAGDTVGLKTSGLNLISGLSIYGFSQAAIECGGDLNEIYDCLLGTNPDQDFGIGNGEGIRFINSERTELVWCQISGNFKSGVRLKTRNMHLEIERCLIGTDLSGNMPLSNGGNGIYATDSAVESTFRSNLVSGNAQNGILLSGEDVRATLICLCDIGITKNQFFKLGNGGHGVFIKDSSSNAVSLCSIGGNDRSGVAISGLLSERNGVSSTQIGSYYNVDNLTIRHLGNAQHGVLITNAPGNTVGHFGSFLSNEINGNHGDGVRVSGAGAKGNNIFRNRIGVHRHTDKSGLGNLGDGIQIMNAASSTTVLNNEIGNNLKSGITIKYSGNNSVRRNLIGLRTNHDETFHTAGNGSFGIRVLASGNSIGGRVRADGNYVVANRQGIVVSKPNGKFNVVENNLIGVAPDDLPLHGDVEQDFGVLVSNGAHDNLIASNVVRNCQTGIRIARYNETNSLTQNAISNNLDLGIDTGPVGPNPIPLNNPAAEQGAPIISGVTVVGSDLRVTYSMDEDERIHAFPMQIEFYFAGGDGQGYSFRGRDQYDATDWANGNKVITIADGAIGIDTDAIVGTATNSYGNTSEFSAASD